MDVASDTNNLAVMRILLKYEKNEDFWEWNPIINHALLNILEKYRYEFSDNKISSLVIKYDSTRAQILKIFLPYIRPDQIEILIEKQENKIHLEMLQILLSIPNLSFNFDMTPFIEKNEIEFVEIMGNYQTMKEDIIRFFLTIPYIEKNVSRRLFEKARKLVK